MKQKMYTEEEVETLLDVQRANCYVAVLSATKNEEIAAHATSAPEPGTWRDKKPEKDENLAEAYETLEDLSKFLDDRISDLHNVKGGMQSRHCYIFYRSHVWDAMSKLKKLNYFKNNC
jgi:hypothetical protein